MAIEDTNHKPESEVLGGSVRDSWDAFRIIEKSFGGVLHSTNGDNVDSFSLWDEGETPSLLTRVQEFKNGRRGIGFIPKGDEVKLRESLVREAFDKSEKVQIPVDKSGTVKISSEGRNATIELESGAYGTYVSKITFDRRGPPMKDSKGEVMEPEVEINGGVTKPELGILAAALTVNGDFLRLAVGNGIPAGNLDYLNVPVWVEIDPHREGNKSGASLMRMNRTGVDKMAELKEKGII